MFLKIIMALSLSSVMLMAVDVLFYSVLGRGNGDSKAMDQARLVIYILRFLLPLLTIVIAVVQLNVGSASKST